VTVKYNVEMAKDNDHEVQLPPDGPYRCSELCVHLTPILALNYSAVRCPR